MTIAQGPTNKSWEDPVNLPWMFKKHKVCIDIYKTLNDLSPSVMKEIFELRLCSRPVREPFKGFVRYIFASLFCVSKREHF